MIQAKKITCIELELEIKIENIERDIPYYFSRANQRNAKVRIHQLSVKSIR